MKIVRDYSGKPKNANTDLLFLLLSNGFTPILTVPILDENKVAVNTENDDIVRVLQEQMQSDVIIQLIEAPGFLNDPDDPNSLVDSISSAELERREQQVTGRMKRKMLALRKLFDGGAAKVIISDGRVERPVRDALDGKGTVIS